MSLNNITVNVTEDIEPGIRIDNYLSIKFSEYSRTRIQRWIKSGKVLLNDRTVLPSYLMKSGDTISLEIPEPEETDILPEKMELDIVYEDSDIIVINKPVGLVVHPGAGNHSGTLLNGIIYHVKDMAQVGDRRRPGVVHRLDKDTSGLIIFAKNDKSHLKLTDDIKKRMVKRIYHAIVHGVIPHIYGTCDAPIGRDPKDRKKMTVTDKNSKPAVTHFKRLDIFENFSYLEVTLETGRTHQIRVHMRYIGHPVAGDTVYGYRRKTPISRPALHAKELRFNHPTTGKRIELTSELPEDFQTFLSYLRKHSSR